MPRLNPITTELLRRLDEVDRKIAALEAERASAWAALAAMCEGNPSLTNELADDLIARCRRAQRRREER